MSVRDDTIVAIATPPGQGGIGVVRLSGTRALAVATGIFRGKLRDHRAAYGVVVDPISGDVIDEALALCMRAPHSYTREDVIELQTHGSPLALRRTVELCLRAGARLAEPGEFTLRAFLHGRLDLAQAEAVLDVIQAQSDASLRLAVQGASGGLSARVASIRSHMLELLAYLSARLDFPDDDVPAHDITPELDEIETALKALLETADYGIVLRQGLRVTIAGLPNVGKSSLLNRLLRTDRAIVTPVAGTTRDTLEETADLGGVPIVLTDTAGLHETDDLVERAGVVRSEQAIEHGDAILLVLDAGRPLLPKERGFIQATAGRPRVIAINKADLIPLDSMPPCETPEAVLVSALTGAGLPELERRLASLAGAAQTTAAGGATVTNPRHKLALERSLERLHEAQVSLAARLPEDFVSIDLRGSLDALSEITGESVTDDLLETIFHKFCIGK